MGSASQAYNNLVQSGKQHQQQGKVLYAILHHAPLTRRQLVRATGLEINAVCGRVAELLEVGLIEVDGEVACGVTGQQVEILVPVYEEEHEVGETGLALLEDVNKGDAVT